MIPTLPTEGRSTPLAESSDPFRQPAYDCQELREGMKLTVYIPGADGAGVEIEGRGSDLTVVARKTHFVRVNFNALQLENVQRDYRLRLRLGSGFDFSRMAAEITGGILTVTVPKRTGAETRPLMRRVA